MNRIRTFLVDGERVDVPENELDAFYSTFNGTNVVEIESYDVPNENGESDRVEVPENERDEFLQTFGAESGFSPNKIHRVQMDDGSETEIGDAQANAYVMARRGGNQMSRGLLRTAGIPDWYGKTVADRENIADQMDAWYPQVMQPQQEEVVEEPVMETPVAEETPYVEHVPDKYDANIPSFRDEVPSNSGILPFDPTNLNGVVRPDDVLDKPDGMLDYLKTAKEAEYGRELNAVEATAANLPFVGTSMDSNEKRKEGVLKRLYKGDYKDSLEASKLALSIGYDPEEIRAINDAAKAEPPEEAYGDDGEFVEGYVDDPEAKARDGFSKLVEGELADRITTRQKKGDKLSKFDLNILQKAGTGAAGLVKTVAEIANPASAAITLAPSMMNRASDMSAGEWANGVDGRPVELIEGDDKDMSMLKGLGGASAERLVWMNPWMSKWAGAVAKKAGGSMLANNAAQVVDMTLKNDITDLVDSVAGLNVSEVEGNKSLGKWAEDHFMPQNLVGDLVHSAIAHVGMKGLRLATPSGRKALANEIYAEMARRGQKEVNKDLDAAQEWMRKQDARDEAKTRYDANLSEEAGWNIDKTAEELVGADPELKFKVIDRATKLAKDRTELEDPVKQRELVEKAAEQIGDEMTRTERMEAGDKNEARIIDEAANAEAREAKRIEAEEAFKDVREPVEEQKLTEEPSKIDAEVLKTDTDAAFRTWAVDRDGKPLEFASPEQEAESRKVFDMLVKMGKVDPETGLAKDTTFAEVPEKREISEKEPVEAAEESPVEVAAEAPTEAPRAENEALTNAAKVLKTDAYLPEADLRDKLANWKKNVSLLGGARKAKMQEQIDAAEMILAERAKKNVDFDKNAEAPVAKVPDGKGRMVKEEAQKTTDVESMSDAELGGKIAKAAQDYEWSMSNGRDIRPYKNGMMELVGKADAHDLGVLIKAAEIETARKFKWKKNYEGKKVEPHHIRSWRELKEEAQRRLNEIEGASKTAPATPPAASAPKKVESTAQTAEMKKRPVTGAAAKKQAEAKEEGRLRTTFIENEAPHGMMAFLAENGALMGKPAKRKVKDVRTQKSKFVYDDQAAGDALDNFFDGMTDAERKTWENRLFGSSKNRSSGATQGDGATDALRKYFNNPNMTIDEALSMLRKEYDNYGAFKKNGGKTSEELHSEWVENEGRVNALKNAKVGENMIDIDGSGETYFVDAYDPKTGIYSISSDNPLYEAAEKEASAMRVRIKDGSIEVVEPAKGLKLESATPDEIAAEEKRIADRKEIERRQNAPLKTGTGETGQDLMDLGGAEGEDLFNRTQKPKNALAEPKPKEGTPMASLTNAEAEKLLGEDIAEEVKELSSTKKDAPLNEPPSPVQGSTTNPSVDPSYNPTAGYGSGVKDPVSRREILEEVKALFSGEVAIRGKNTTQMSSWASGHFEPGASIIRSKDPNSLRTIPHEIGHFIHYLYDKGDVFRGVKNRNEPFPKDVAIELGKMGHKLYGDQRPNGGYQREGMAELIKFYMQDNAEGLKQNYPNAYKWLTNDFAKAHPDVMKRIDKIRTMVDNYTNQSAEQEYEANKVKKRGVIGKFVDTVNSIIEAAKPTQENWIDSGAFIMKGVRGAKMEKLLDWQGAVERGDIAEASRIIENHPALKWKLYNGKAGARAYTSLKDGLTDLSGSRRYTYADAGITPPRGRNATDSIPSMREIFSDFSNKELDDWQIYAKAKVFQEHYHNNGLEAGVSPESTRQILANKKYNNPKFENALREWTDYNHAILHLLVDSGAISQKAFDQIVKANAVYTKIMRHEEKSGLFKDAIRKMGGRAVNQRKGSTRQVEDLFEATLVDHEKIIGAAMQADLLKSIVELGNRAEKIGTKGGMSVAPNWIHEVANAKEKISISGDKMKDAIEKKIGKDPELEHIIDLLTNDGADKEAFSIFRDKASNGKNGVVSLYDQEGNLHTYELPEINGQAWADGLMGFTKADRDNILEKLAKIATSGVRAGATMLNPKFAVRNLVRDALHGSVMNEYGTILPGAGSVQGIAMDLLNTDTKKLYEQMNLGMGTFMGTSKLDTAHNEANVLKARNKLSEQLNKGVIKSIADIVGFSESGTRLKELKLVRDWSAKHGLSEKAANMLAGANALDITLDFQRSGLTGRKLNKGIVFLNAGIQGIDQFGRAMGVLRAQPWQLTQGSIFEKGNRKGGFVRMGRTAIKGAANLASLSLGALAYNMSDDERWRKWKELPAHEKWNYVSYGDTRLPVPFELGYMFMSLPTAVIAEANGDKGAIKECIQTFTKSLPAQAGGFHELLRNVALLAPVADVIANEDWKGSEIVPERKKKNSPAWEWYGPKTSQAAIMLGKAIAEWLGKDKMAKNPICAPAYLQTILDGYTGGMFSRVADTAISTAKGELPEISNRKSDIPIVGTFFRRPNTSRVVNDFYDRSDTLTRKYNDVTFDGATPEEYGEKVLHDDLAAKLSPIWNENKEIMVDKSLSSNERNDKIDANIAKAQDMIRKMKDGVTDGDLRKLGIARAAASLSNPNATETKNELDKNVLKGVPLSDIISALRAYGNEFVYTPVKNSRGFKTGKMKRSRRWSTETINKRIRAIRQSL